MSQDLRSRLKELETTVEALTDEIVEVQQRLDELEGEDGGRDEVGVGVDEEEEKEDDDIYVA
jgi:uncharacterized protein YqgV (UPF0045/DUF77 family)